MNCYKGLWPCRTMSFVAGRAYSNLHVVCPKFYFVCFDPRITAKVQPRPPVSWYKHSRFVLKSEQHHEVQVDDGSNSRPTNPDDSSTSKHVFNTLFSVENMINLSCHIEDKLELCVYCDHLLWAQNALGSTNYSRFQGSFLRSGCLSDKAPIFWTHPIERTSSSTFVKTFHSFRYISRDGFLFMNFWYRTSFFSRHSQSYFLKPLGTLVLQAWWFE